MTRSFLKYIIIYLRCYILIPFHYQFYSQVYKQQMGSHDSHCRTFEQCRSMCCNIDSSCWTNYSQCHDGGIQTIKGLIIAIVVATVIGCCIIWAIIAVIYACCVHKPQEQEQNSAGVNANQGQNQQQVVNQGAMGQVNMNRQAGQVEGNINQASIGQHQYYSPYQGQQQNMGYQQHQSPTSERNLVRYPQHNTVISNPRMDSNMD